ncbi:MAG: glutamate mutase L [Anaerolineaceae bacterium]
MMALPNSPINAESLLAIDVGSVYTRALFFDVVEGSYHFIAAGQALSTAFAPYHDAGLGITNSIRELEKLSSQTLLNPSAQLIIPCRTDGTGVDHVVTTLSAVQDLNLTIIGLVPEVSLQTAMDLAAGLFAKVRETIGLDDFHSTEVRLDRLIRSEPDVILFTGGTDHGAGRPVLRLLDLVSLVLKVLPRQIRPHVIYAGNPLLAKRVQEALENLTDVHVVTNLRPTMEVTDPGAASQVLSKLTVQTQIRKIRGLNKITRHVGPNIEPTPSAINRVIGFLSKVYDPSRGVLGADLGASTTTIAAAFNGETFLEVNRPLGMGTGLVHILEKSQLKGITRWLAEEIPDNEVREYIWQKSRYPASLPLNRETMMIEQACARQALTLAYQKASLRWPVRHPQFEPIMVSGSVLSQTENRAQSLMMVLDGLQPAGITTIILDPGSLINALGTAARVNPIIPVQVLESGAFINLGSVISLITTARPGTVVASVHLEFEDGTDSRTEIQAGELICLPVRPGQHCVVNLILMHGARIDQFTSRKPKSFKIFGGSFGLVVDARGRPLRLPAGPDARRELLNKWAASLKG